MNADTDRYVTARLDEPFGHGKVILLGEHAHLVKLARHGRRDAAAGLLDHDRQTQLAGDAPDGLQRATKVTVTARLGQLLRGVQVDAQRVRRHTLHRLAHGGRRHGGQLDHAQVRAQEHAGRGVPHLVRPRGLGPHHHGPLAAEAERDARRLGRPRQRAVDLPRHIRAAGHPGDHERGPERTSEQGGRQLHVAGRSLGLRGVDQMDVVQQGPAMKVGLAGRGDGQVIRLAL